MLMLQCTNILLLILNTMALYINHAIHSMVAIVRLVEDIQLDILARLVDMAVDTYVTMSLIVVNIVMPMNLISLSIVQNSLKRQHTVVKSLFPCGEETDRRNDAATARNVRANGSLFAHLAL